jgi:hypothetical protein
MVKISITSKSSKLKVPKAEKHNNLQQNIFHLFLTPKLRYYRV